MEPTASCRITVVLYCLAVGKEIPMTAMISALLNPLQSSS